MRKNSLVILMLITCGAVAQDEAVQTDSAITPTEVMPLADESLILDVTSLGVRKVAVGERGHVLLSDDGITWTQSPNVPTRTTLTTVYARNGRLWAAGHSGVIISSRDGGDNWELQAADPAQEPTADPNPYLDIFFTDLDNGYALGAYGRMAITRDGGDNWQIEYIADLVQLDEEDYEESIEEDVEDEDVSLEDFTYDSDFSDFDDELYYDQHLNAMTTIGDGRLVIAAEAGSGYVSDDQGESWTYIEMPYRGSLFGVVQTDETSLLAYGLRGNALESTDFGDSWSVLDTGTENTLLGATVLEDGAVVMVGANGEILTRGVDGSFSSDRHPQGEDLAAVLALDSGKLVVVGEAGIQEFGDSQTTDDGQ